MAKTIVSIFKYSVLVLTILVLSHIVQIKGVTLSQHVQNGLNWITGGRTSASISRITRQFSSAVYEQKKGDADGFSHEDRHQLNSLIRQSSGTH